MSSITWTLLPFEQLSLQQLYALLRLRSEVFVMEQQCLYQDLDDRDQVAYHLLGTDQTGLQCYARLLPPGEKYTEAAIGRVLTRQSCRDSGLGRALLAQACEHCDEHWPQQGIRISAQQYLQSFYEGFGFKVVSQPYLEDAIPHLEMLRK